MKTTVTGVVLLATVVAGRALAGTTSEMPAALQKQAKVSLERARKIALKEHPGQIVKEELERERGGSGLRYSFDIKSGKHVWEVGVDGANGKVLENALDDDAKD